MFKSQEDIFHSFDSLRDLPAGPRQLAGLNPPPMFRGRFRMTSESRHIDLSTHRPIDTSTHRHIDLSTHQSIDSSTQRLLTSGF